jgi:hypothetical protein
MTNENDNPATKHEAAVPGVAAQATGSDLPETCVDFSGRKLRRLNRDRMFKTGEVVANMHGQFLWECVAFHAKGVRLANGIFGQVGDYSWEQFFAFYERAPDVVANDQNDQAQPRARRVGL